MFTDREWDIMSVLWECGPSTAAEVREALATTPGVDLAYNSVLTLLRILEDKGHVGHVAEGRAHRYLALVAREDAHRTAVRGFVDRVFQRSPDLLLTHLVRDRSLTPDAIRRLRNMLDAALSAEPGPDAPGSPAETSEGNVVPHQSTFDSRGERSAAPRTADAERAQRSNRRRTP